MDIKKVRVELGQRSYDICIGHGILHGLAGHIKMLPAGRKGAIITNPGLNKLYGESLSRNLSAEGYRITTIEIPAGERWQNGSIRFAIEDYLGAGALISVLNGELSAESFAAKKYFEAFESELKDVIINSYSGKELIEKGFSEDLEIALDMFSGNSIPVLKEKCFVNSVNITI